MASEAEVVIGRMSDEAFWTVDVTDKSQIARWTRLAQQSGGEIIPKSAHWTRFKIPADKLRIGLKKNVVLTDAQREILRQRMRDMQAGKKAG